MGVLKTMSLAVAMLFLCAGCKSVSPDSSALAGVVLRGHTPAQIRLAVEEVFTMRGYKVMHTARNTMILEKEGSTGTSIAYGNWMGTPVTLRVRTRLIQVGEAVYRLECSAARVRDAGGTVEEETPMTRFRRGPFQEMLKEVEIVLARSKPRD
jgi:hypothetical protein